MRLTMTMQLLMLVNDKEQDSLWPTSANVPDRPLPSTNRATGLGWVGADLFMSKPCDLGESDGA